MYESDLMHQTLKAERERETAELLREREYRRAFQPRGAQRHESVLFAGPDAPWRRPAQALHLRLPKTTKGTAGSH